MTEQDKKIKLTYARSYCSKRSSAKMTSLCKWQRKLLLNNGSSLPSTNNMRSLPIATRHCISFASFLSSYRIHSTRRVTMSAGTDSIRTSLQNVAARVEAASLAAGTQPGAQLVAVSKTKPAALIRAAYDVGHRHFGENYVQELAEKSQQLPSDIQWHFIGALQSNKAKLLLSVPNLYIVETVDRVKTASALQKAALACKRSQPLNVLVQVNTSGEESKSGCAPGESADIAQFVHKECSELAFVGLMTIGAPDDSEEPEAFRILKREREFVAGKLGMNERDLILSMGMSADFETAIRMGSTSVRVGSTIFGEREYATATKNVAADTPVSDAQIQRS